MAPKPETTPQDELQNEIDAVADETAAAQQQEQQVSDDDLDADALEALIARREADAEAAGTSPEGEQQAPEQVSAATPPEQERQQPEPPPVPYGRFAEVNRKARDLELENARLRGLAEGVRTAGPRQPAQEAPPEPTPEQKRAAVETEWDQQIEALAKRYDDGEISLADHGKALRRMNAEYQGKVDAAVRQPDTQQPSREPDPEALERDINDDSGVRRATAHLADDNPWLRQPTPGLRRALQEDLAAIQPRGEGWARHIAAQAGHNYDRLGVRSQTVFLRIGMVAAAKEAGLDQQYSRTIPQAAPAAAETPAKPQPGSRPNPGALTPEQRRAKAGLARSHPPDLTQAGSPAGTSQAVTDADIEGMTDEEIAALPEATRKKLMGLA